MRRCAEAEKHDLYNVRLRNSEVKRLAHLHVVERRNLIVEDHAIPRCGRRALNSELGVCLELLDLLGRQIPEVIDVAGLKRGDTHRHISDDPFLDTVEFWQSRLKVFRVSRQHDSIAGRIAFEHERPGADRGRRQFGDLVGRYDLDLALDQDLGETAIAVLELEADGRWVERRHLLDHHVIRSGRRACRRIEDPLEALHHVIGDERTAVVKLDPLAKMERPSLEVLGGVPALGEIRFNLHLRRHPDQAVEHQVVVDVLLAKRGARRVERVEIDANGDLQHPVRGCGAGSHDTDKHG